MTTLPELIPPKVCGNFVYAVERMRDHLDERRALDHSHWQETEGYRHGLGLNMDYTRLLSYEDMGQCLWFTMRRDGELMGHAYFYLDRSVHTQKLIASEDVIYVKPEARIGRNTLAFGHYWIEAAKRIQVTEVTLTRKLANPRAERFFEALHAKPVAVEYVVVIGDQS